MAVHFHLHHAVIHQRLRHRQRLTPGCRGTDPRQSPPRSRPLHPLLSTRVSRRALHRPPQELASPRPTPHRRDKLPDTIGPSPDFKSRSRTAPRHHRGNPCPVNTRAGDGQRPGQRRQGPRLGSLGRRTHERPRHRRRRGRPLPPQACSHRTPCLRHRGPSGPATTPGPTPCGVPAGRETDGGPRRRGSRAVTRVVRGGATARVLPLLRVGGQAPGECMPVGARPHGSLAHVVGPE
ncbi:hypothetical protein QFZ82_001852 [Streptomyces sp. V4I23]|nr:hypothetical protein [Streptomyces sp. V4I23]